MLLYSFSIPFLNLYTTKSPEAGGNPAPMFHEWTLLGNWIVGVLILTNGFGLVHYCMVSDNPRKANIQKNEIDGMTRVLLNLFGLSYSLVFMNTVMWWAFVRDDFSSYFSINLHIILIA